MTIPLKLRRSAVIAGCAALLGLGGLTTAATAVASTTPVHADSHAAASGYDRCRDGYFCIFSDWNGEGTRCQWEQSEVRDTVDLCSFIQQGQPVRSVYNRTDHRVQYYTENGYNSRSRIGSTLAGNKGNLAGSYQIRSFKPQ